MYFTILKRILFFSMLAAGFFASAVSARAETISIVADNWCPYNCASDSEHPGFMIEIAKKVFSKYNIDIKYSILPWADAIEQTRTGKYNAIVGASYMDAPDFIFPNTPQGWMRNVFYVKKGDKWKFENISSLKEVALGVIADYSYNSLLNDYITLNKNNKSRLQIERGDEALKTNIDKLLIEGKIRVVVEAEYVMSYYLTRHEMPGAMEEAGRLRPSEQDNLYIAFASGGHNSQKYANILSKEMKVMRANGELERILQSYGLKDWEK